MIRLTAQERGKDNYGSGEFGASRGSRTHRGVDFGACAGSYVHSATNGTVTKLGFPYADALGFRYVQVTDAEGYDIRYFYVKPSVVVGDVISPDSVIGIVQSLESRYRGITPHIHLEIKDPQGNHIHPVKYLKGEL